METEAETLPAGPVALAAALSGIPVSLLAALCCLPPQHPEDPNSVISAVATCIVVGLGPSCLIGMPIALVALRDPKRSAWSWAVAGAGTAHLSILLVGGWTMGLLFPFLLFSYIGAVFVMLGLAGTVVGAFSGLIARGLLALFIGMSDSG